LLRRNILGALQQTSSSSLGKLGSAANALPGRSFEQLEKHHQLPRGIELGAFGEGERRGRKPFVFLAVVPQAPYRRGPFFDRSIIVEYNSPRSDGFRQAATS
jgi:hypothetical protein